MIRRMTVRTFDKANRLAAYRFDLMGDLRALLKVTATENDRDPTIGGCCERLGPYENIYYVDDPEGWVIFFRIEDDFEPVYLSYGCVWETLIESISEATSLEKAIEEFMWVQRFEMVDDAYQLWLRRPSNANVAREGVYYV